MGFFSFKCAGCNQSLRSNYGVTDKSVWMRSVIAYDRSGKYYQGAYDGYGRIETAGDEANLSYGGFTVYHQRCWRLLGRPKGYAKEAAHAPDQGYFTDFHPPKPQNRGDLENLRTVGD